MYTRLICAFAVVGALASSVSAAEEAPSPESQLAIAKALESSLAQVEFTLKYDKGQQPAAAGWSERCPNCGRYHGSGASRVVTEERPYEAPAFVLSPTEVITPDPMLHPRFIKGIAVRFGEQLVKAEPAAYATSQNAIILKLDKPLEGAAPLAFEPGGKPPYLAVTYSQLNGAWTINVKALSPTVAITRAGRKFLAVPSYILIVDEKGVPVGMSMNDELPADDSWKGSPLKWPTVSAKKMSDDLKALEERFKQGVLRVALSFRSPRKTAESRYHRSYDDEGGGTERNVLGALIDENRILVLANLKPKLTARLQRIIVHPPGGKPVPAKFTHTLKDYGAFVATLEQPLPGTLAVAEGKITAYRNELLLSAQVQLQGEKLTTYYAHRRIASFDIGWKRRVFPEVGGRDENLVLFDAKGRLVAMPIARRETVAEQRRWSRSYSTLTPAAHLDKTLAEDPAKYADLSNIPLTEGQEFRLAWLGAELQPLNKQLARVNKVSHLTRDGELGGIVSYLYPGSPAAKAGIKVGDILMRLHVEGQPKPIEVRVEEDSYRGRGFPWARLDRLPEQYFDQLPRPWPPVENTLTRTLTDLGFGKKYVAEFFRDGKVVREEFKVIEGPPHHDSAAKHKSKPLGLTVRDLTFEVRRYFQKTAKDPGVIVAKIEPGSKVSVAGIKPFEIITRVNGKPVMNVEDFGKLIAEPGELRLSVTRMTKGRVVTIKMKPAPAPDKKPAEKEPAAEKTPDEAPSTEK